MSSRGRSIVIAGNRSTTAPCCSATASSSRSALSRSCAARHPDAPVIGDGEQVLLPGFVNGHHHVGLTPVQLGSPDMPLELWFATRLVIRDVDLYLDTLYSAFEMIASGITTVQHIHGWMPGSSRRSKRASDEVIRAYEDIGMRVSYCFALRDQNHLVYERERAILASLPADCPARCWRRHFGRFQLSAEDCDRACSSIFTPSTTTRSASRSSSRRRTCIGAPTRR